MALVSSAIEGAIKSALPFERNSHYKGDIMIEAIAKATKDVFTSMAFITVNSGGGGIYSIVGVTPAALEGAINGYLTINISSKYARGGLLSKAAAKGIATAISASTVAVPSWTSGLFPVIGFMSGTIKSVMQSELESMGINTTSKHARIMDMVSAIANGVAISVTATALYPANGTSGGVFVMT
jgi:hypothetical protein